MPSDVHVHPSASDKALSVSISRQGCEEQEINSSKSGISSVICVLVAICRTKFVFSSTLWTINVRPGVVALPFVPLTKSGCSKRQIGSRLIG
jgi:hypothetical protein